MSDKYYGIIYKITNKINGKVYIGQTTEKNGFNGRYHHEGNGIEKVYNYNLSRMNNGYSCNPHLVSSIEKYGFDAFEVDEKFDIAYSKEELDWKETFYIDYYDAYKNGYNRAIGGGGSAGHKQPKGSEHYSAKSIVCLETGVIYGSIIECANEMNLNSGSISQVILKRKGRGKTVGGFHFVTLEEYTKLSNSEKSEILKPTRCKNVNRPFICIENNKIYTNKNECARELKITHSAVHRSLREGKTACGYTFKYIDKEAS